MWSACVCSRVEKEKARDKATNSSHSYTNFLARISQCKLCVSFMRFIVPQSSLPREYVHVFHQLTRDSVFSCILKCTFSFFLFFPANRLLLRRIGWRWWLCRCIRYTRTKYQQWWCIRSVIRITIIIRRSILVRLWCRRSRRWFRCTRSRRWSFTFRRCITAISIRRIRRCIASQSEDSCSTQEKVRQII